MILIKNGRVIDPLNKIDKKQDIIIENDRIKEIGENLDLKYNQKDLKVIDADNLVIAPGFVDVHVHFRDPGLTYKEDIHTGANSAAKGGYTTVVCMANTKPPIDNANVLKDLVEREQSLLINVLNTANVTVGMQGKELTDFKALKEANAIGLTDDGIPIKDEKLVLEAFKKAKELDLPISLHEEDPALIGSSGVNQGAISKKIGVKGAPAIAEDVLVARDCMLALEVGNKIDIQHISSKRSVEIIELAKKMGANVYAEVTPQHIALTEEAVLTKGTMAKVNPPLRTKEDKDALIMALKKGVIDMIATDHAPHSKEEKMKSISEAPSGMIGLETALAVCITNLVKSGHLSLMQLIEKMTINPARFYNLEVGHLTEGAKADIVIFDDKQSWIVDKKDFVSKASNSPFIGEKLYGRVKYTICNGKIVYSDMQEL
ncbi:dihydroorotase [Lachnobacterium bovis]|uniref:Dihydroorotase n=1 Tax=Lachnobacterium bovis TaxID=140626 RepID=A0A1H9Q2M0_9FIRM|nr:dihydroorotase [Lachnobacterium bovis]SER54335.1 dihydroorotase [Lachnobacterium bovis]